MSLVDQVFGGIPGPLIAQWGISATYLKASQNQQYDPETGTVMGCTQEIPIKIVPTQLRPEEVQGFYQMTDVKILIAASSLGDYYPQTTDSIRYLQNGVQRTAKIIGMMSYRGDFSILHVVVARLG
ncbi:MAG: hypothetical protein JRE18_02270 [Deltaproteobacteria bacterium]|jgi:hypothetical protein|nr:hypothetical protein [Deltaproteobacteria bacterium]